MTPPRLDAHRHRCAPGFHEFSVTADLVSDKDGLVKDHPIDRHCRASSAGTLRGKASASEIHL